MIIGNPIYDEYFKRLMSHEHIAKFFIGTLLKCKVKSVQFRPQEFTYLDSESQALKIYRVDFAAVIKEADGKTQKVLIEVQKSHSQTALARFRGYLGQHYISADPNETEPLPIITIYILGFNLPDIKLPCFKVGRYYMNIMDDKLTDERSYFMERLTHDGYVVQTARLPEHRGRNPLNELLKLFEQRNFTNAERTEKDYPYEPTSAKVREMCKVLSGLVVDPETRKRVAMEYEYERIQKAGYDTLGREMEEVKQKLEENAKALEEKDKALEKIAKALAAEKAKNAENAKAREENAKAISAALARIAAIEQRNT
jgi:hypothetical protein